MTTYTAIADSEIDVDSPITESVMTRLRNNPVAITEGATGAPKIKQAAIDAAAVGQAQLKTTTGDVSFPGPGGNMELCVQPATTSFGGIFIHSGTGSSYSTALPGGEYGLLPTVKNVSGTYTVRTRYVQASPPYDHGDGIVGLYIFALINKAGEILSTYSAPDAPWHFKGPNQVRATHYGPGGKTYARVKKIDAELRAMGLAAHEAIKKGAFSAMELVDRMASDSFIFSEITIDQKNANFAHVKHPFENVAADQSIVLIDPAGDMSHKLQALMTSGGDVGQLLHDGYLKIGEKVKRKGLSGIAVHSLKWKD